MLQVRRYRAGIAPHWVGEDELQEEDWAQGDLVAAKAVAAARTDVAAPVIVQRADDPRLARLAQRAQRGEDSEDESEEEHSEEEREDDAVAAAQIVRRRVRDDEESEVGLQGDFMRGSRRMQSECMLIASQAHSVAAGE